MNLRNLERVLAREEEVKKKAIVHKAVYKGPQIRYLSKDGKLCSKIASNLVGSFQKSKNYICLNFYRYLQDATI